ncbi:monofunctional biosynthetic peptidoglycan transglycosylase [Candidatus Spongiihabitans sp.]|uniref:monofunctional biosynthetic peptidoglycan transglycosylase n=1 Tax=Candidatus Spongiihabitans sp. TaxID=3101308 RepID=UPI003C7C766A
MRQKLKTRLFTIALFLLLMPVICAIIFIGALRWIDPITSSVMLQNNIHSVWSGAHEFAKYQWHDWDQISGHAAVAVIAAEDQRFPAHFGIDFNELLHVIASAITADSERPRGASTITQQVAKNLFLWSGRSYLRKALEAGLAVLIELMWSKQRILEVYLNIAQMGDNLFGIGAASAFYYHKTPEQLNRHEAARIAAVLPNPTQYSVLHPSAFVVKRQRWILKQMAQLGGKKLLEQLD